MLKGREKTLVIGYGNPGRMDDGLGPAFAAEIERANLNGVDVDSDYQLTVEDSSSISEYSRVIFVDASVDGQEPFDYFEVEPDENLSFSSHSASPGAVLALCENLFSIRPKAYVLSIRGYDFNEFGEGLSEKAQANLALAVSFAEKLLQEQGAGSPNLSYVVNGTDEIQ